MLLHKSICTALFVVALLTCHPVEGLYKHEEDNVFAAERGRNKWEPILDGNVRLHADTFTPVAVYDPDYDIKGDTPQEMADDFLMSYTAVLQLDDDTSSSDLQLSTYRQTSVWTNLRFNQVVNGVPVLGSHVVVTIDQNNKVKMITSTYTRGVNVDTDKMAATMSSKDVRNVITSEKYEGKDDSLRMFNLEQVIFPRKKEPSVIAWKAVYAKKNTNNEFMAVIDDRTQEILEDKDITLDKKGRENNVVQKNARILPIYEKGRENYVRGELNINETEKNENLRASKSEAGGKASPANGFVVRIAQKFDIVQSFLELIVEVLQKVLSFVENPSYMPTKPPPSVTTPTPSPTELGNTPVGDDSVNDNPVGDDSVNDNPVGDDGADATNTPTISSAPTTTVVGNIFDPDPISSGQGTYGTGGFIDNDDQTSSDLNDQLVPKNLRDLRFSERKYHLEGPWAKIVDVGSPYTGLFSQESRNFYYDREEQGFEAVNCYYHIDNMMRYINEDLGIELSPHMHEGGVRFDPHGSEGEDNSFYSYDGHLEFGEGGVDDGEDPDVIIHELGHGVHDWITNGLLSREEGLSEGFGDYFATSYSRSKGLYSTSDEEYNWVFKWDAHNEYWPGRVVNSDSLYPGGLSGQVHTDGQIWSTCNMKVWDFLGREKSDKAHLVGLSSTGSTSNQLDAATAVLLAAKSLGYTTDEIEGIVDIYNACGYDVNTDICGDGVIAESEECEGSDIGDAVCSSIGCGQGVPFCNRDTCKIDYSACSAGPGEMDFSLVLQTDNYGAETSWSVLSSLDYSSVLSGSGYRPNTRYEISECVPDGTCYEFEIKDSYNDGICCTGGEGFYRIKFDGVDISGTNGDFGSSNQHELCAS